MPQCTHCGISSKQTPQRAGLRQSQRRAGDRGVDKAQQPAGAGDPSPPWGLTDTGAAPLVLIWWCSSRPPRIWAAVFSPPSFHLGCRPETPGAIWESALSLTEGLCTHVCACMSLCMRLCTCVSLCAGVHKCACVHVCMHVFLWAGVCMCVCVHLCVCVSVQASVCVRVSLCACIYVSACRCPYVCARLCARASVYTHMCMHVFLWADVCVCVSACRCPCVCMYTRVCV